MSVVRVSPEAWVHWEHDRVEVIPAQSFEMGLWGTEVVPSDPDESA
jgi:hypothetical protein